MKAIDFDKYLETQMRNPEFRKAYEELEDEYELAKQIIRFRIDRNLTQTQLAPVGRNFSSRQSHGWSRAIIGT